MSYEQRSQAAAHNELIVEHQEITGELDTKPGLSCEDSPPSRFSATCGSTGLEQP